MAISELFIQHLQKCGELGANDLARLRAIPTTRITALPGTVIVPRQDNPGRSAMLTQGMAAQIHPALGRAGGRVISGLHIAGDFVNLDGLVQDRMTHEVVALGCCEVEFIHHEELRDLFDRYPVLIRLIMRRLSDGGAIYRRWLVVAASLRSSAHLAHLICELYTRLAGIGAARNLRLSLPLLQRELAEVLGYSSIHVNRAVRDLRDRGLLHWNGSEIGILNWPGLVHLARFDPDYLGPDLARNHARLTDTADSCLSES